MKLKTKKSIFPKLIVAIIIVAVVGYLTVALTTNRWPFGDSKVASPSQNEADNNDKPYVDDQPGSIIDQEMADDQKQATYDREHAKDNPDQSVSSNNTKIKKVDVTLTTLYQEGDEVRANGFVTGVVENNGTCTLSLTNQIGKTVSVSRKGHENATNTTCGQSIIKTSELSPGKWTAVLSYSSATATGISNDKAPPIEIK